MSKCVVSGKLGWITLGLLVVLLLGCKPGRPQFALPKIKMITGENLHSVVAFSLKEVTVFGSHGIVYYTGTGGGSLEEWKLRENGIKDLLLCEASFVDDTTGWVVGIKGTIIHTTDGGKSWNDQESGTEKNIFSVSFADAQNGWAVGEFGTIIHTADGGENWKFQSKGTDKMLNSVCFVDAQTGDCERRNNC